MGMETINAADWGVLPGDDVSLAARLGALLSTLRERPGVRLCICRVLSLLTAEACRASGIARTTMRAVQAAGLMLEGFRVFYMGRLGSRGVFHELMLRAESAHWQAACDLRIFPWTLRVPFIRRAATGGPPAADVGVDRPGKIS
jgi:hypothetical protein